MGTRLIHTNARRTAVRVLDAAGRLEVMSLGMSSKPCFRKEDQWLMPSRLESPS